MVSKDPEKRKQIARLGGIAQHEKHGCLIPIESRRKGGRNSAKSQNRKVGKYSEKLFKKFAESKGYEVYLHGFPDAVMVKDNEVVFVEVKCQKGRLTERQKKTFQILEKLGFKVRVWVAPSTR